MGHADEARIETPGADKRIACSLPVARSVTTFRLVSCHSVLELAGVAFTNANTQVTGYDYSVYSFYPHLRTVYAI